jgi:hypothetical protein
VVTVIVVPAQDSTAPRASASAADGSNRRVDRHDLLDHHRAVVGLPVPALDGGRVAIDQERRRHLTRYRRTAVRLDLVELVALHASDFRLSRLDTCCALIGATSRCGSAARRIHHRVHGGHQ